MKDFPPLSDKASTPVNCYLPCSLDAMLAVSKPISTFRGRLLASFAKSPFTFRRFVKLGKAVVRTLSIVSNTLFDFGVILLMLGISTLFISQLETARFVSRNLIFIALALIFFLVINYRYERQF